MPSPKPPIVASKQNVQRKRKRAKATATGGDGAADASEADGPLRTEIPVKIEVDTSSTQLKKRSRDGTTMPDVARAAWQWVKIVKDQTDGTPTFRHFVQIFASHCAGKTSVTEARIEIAVLFQNMPSLLAATLTAFSRFPDSELLPADSAIDVQRTQVYAAEDSSEKRQRVASGSSGGGGTVAAAEGGTTAAAGDGNSTMFKRFQKLKLALFVGFLGSPYQGFQRNPGVSTIEDELEKAIYAAGGIMPSNYGDLRKIGWSRSARTDKGVSATAMVVACRLCLVRPLEDMVKAVNEQLPPTVRVFQALSAPKNFDAKTNCSMRRYEYMLPTYALLPPSMLPAALAQPGLLHPMDVLADGLSEFRRVLRSFEGTHQFHNFTAVCPPCSPFGFASEILLVSFNGGL
eukprot:SAG31_NODE_1797_length_7244_cov_8.328621_1_plen_403_part_00